MSTHQHQNSGEARPKEGAKRRPVWRSLEQKREPEKAAARAAEKQPQPLVDDRSLLSRRGFMSLTAATGAMASLNGCVRRPVENILPYSKAPEYVVPGNPLNFATVLTRRGDALGVLVTTHEGRPTKVEGNPAHMRSGGATDVWAQAELMNLYDPSRSKFPAQIEKGEAKQVQWADIDATLSAELEKHASNGGKGLAILHGGTISPSFMATREALKKRFPNARITTYSPVNSDNAVAGAKIAYGEQLNTQHHFGAPLVLSIDSDHLQTEAGAVKANGLFGPGRRIQSANGRMSRVYSVESNHSMTGSNADHRLRLPARDMDRYLRALAKELVAAHNVDLGPVSAALGDVSTDGIPEQWIKAVATDLAAHRGEAAIVIGSRQPAHVHALGMALNTALRNMGPAVGMTPVIDPEAPDNQVEDLKALVAAMNGGEVKSLLIFGTNPVWDAPADVDFGAALTKVPFSFHLSSHVDETTVKCAWHMPLAHAFETWGDARSLEGQVAIQQPLIRPIWGARSELEVLAFAAGLKGWRGYNVVRRSFRKATTGMNFEQAWRQTLHTGAIMSRGTLFQRSQAPINMAAIADALKANAPKGGALSASNLEVAFHVCPKMHEGTYANNAWLLELPDQMTKLSWDNAALMSPATAKELGVKNGDIIKLAGGAGEVEIAAFELPGHADNSVTAYLGWGRERAGRYGKDKASDLMKTDISGFNVYPLRTAEGFWFADGFKATKTGRTYFLAQTQEHGEMRDKSGWERPMAIDATLDEYREKPNFAAYKAVDMHIPPLWEKVKYEGHKWGMAIDLSACTGCNACTIACQAENNLPCVGKRQVSRGREMYWLRIDRYFVGDDENNPEIAVQPIGCQHCEDAPCENVCPVNATTHSPEGLNDMAYNRCIGTRYCMNNCPYKVRRFNYRAWHGFIDNEFNSYDDIANTRKMQFNPNVTVRMRGVVEKCTYCVQRIQEGKLGARREKRELRDGEIQTACQQACPTRAITFGDLNDQNSAVAREANRDRNYRLLAELGTRPRTTFLAKVRNPNPRMEG